MDVNNIIYIMTMVIMVIITKNYIFLLAIPFLYSSGGSGGSISIPKEMSEISSWHSTMSI